VDEADNSSTFVFGNASNIIWAVAGNGVRPVGAGNAPWVRGPTTRER